MKTAKYIFFCSLFIVLTLFGWTAYLSFQYYTPPSYRRPFQMSQETEDTLRIAYIGDSWAYWHKDHECQIAQLLEDTLHRPVKVHSYGICGRTSREIYENMFENSNFKEFLTKRRYEYCYVSVGINDTHKKMSIQYYKQSISHIIQLLLINNVHPIIQEIPDYDIKMIDDKQKSYKKFVRRIYMYFHDMPVDCKQMFRDALDDLICDNGYHDNVSIIRYKAWNNNYSNDLNHIYSPDHLHLNKDGYAILDSVIAKEILTIEHNNTHHSASDACHHK